MKARIFILWKRKIQNAFSVFKCLDAFKEDFKVSQDTMEVNERAVYILVSFISDDVLKMILNLDTAIKIMKTLEAKYDDKNFKGNE